MKKSMKIFTGVALAGLMAAGLVPHDEPKAGDKASIQDTLNTNTFEAPASSNFSVSPQGGSSGAEPGDVTTNADSSYKIIVSSLEKKGAFTTMTVDSALAQILDNSQEHKTPRFLSNEQVREKGLIPQDGVQYTTPEKIDQAFSQYLVNTSLEVASIAHQAKKGDDSLGMMNDSENSASELLKKQQSLVHERRVDARDINGFNQALMADRSTIDQVTRNAEELYPNALLNNVEAVKARLNLLEKASQTVYGMHSNEAMASRDIWIDPDQQGFAKLLESKPNP